MMGGAAKRGFEIVEMIEGSVFSLEARTGD